MKNKKNMKKIPFKWAKKISKFFILQNLSEIKNKPSKFLILSNFNPSEPEQGRELCIHHLKTKAYIEG